MTSVFLISFPRELRGQELHWRHRGRECVDVVLGKVSPVDVIERSKLIHQVKEHLHSQTSVPVDFS